MCLLSWVLCLGNGLNTYIGFVVAFLAERNNTVHECIQRVVTTHSHIFTGVVYCSALTYDDVAGFGELSAKYFHAKTFAF